MADTWEEELRQKLRCGEAMEAMKAAKTGQGLVQCEEKMGITSHFRWGLLYIYYLWLKRTSIKL